MGIALMSDAVARAGIARCVEGGQLPLESTLIEMVEAFVDEMIKTGIYVTNDLFKDSFVGNKLYSTSAELPFTRMILKTIDKSQEPYSQHADYQSFDTVEHIMPQKLSSEWKQYLGNDSNNQILKIHINSVGNLCLFNKRANSRACQDLFEENIKSYPDASYLTRELKNHKSIWNIQAIISRSERLAQFANNLWKWSYNKDRDCEVVPAHINNDLNEMFYLSANIPHRISFAQKCSAGLREQPFHCLCFHNTARLGHAIRCPFTYKSNFGDLWGALAAV